MTARVPSENRLAVRLCLVLGRLFDSGPLARCGVRNASLVESAASYSGHRVGSAPRYYELFTRFASFHGKVVADLGCARGDLLASFLEWATFEAVGIDISEEALSLGRRAHGDRLRLVQSTTSSIALESESVDVVYTIDTVEHLSRPHEIFAEAHRILRPGGVFLVHFHPWLGPYGAHLGDVLPFPWPHVLFSMETLLAAAAVRYEAADYRAPWYRFDEAGQRRPNPFREDWGDYLNRLTIRGFRQMVGRLPFECLHFRRIGFGGTTVKSARLLAVFSQVPGLDEFFSRAVFAVLRKGDPAANGRLARRRPLTRIVVRRRAALRRRSRSSRDGL